MMDNRDNALGTLRLDSFLPGRSVPIATSHSGVYPASEHARYVDRLIQDLAAAGEWAIKTGVALPRKVDTVYLGGGTPSLLAPDLLARLFARRCGRSSISIRMPRLLLSARLDSLPAAHLPALVAAGVNRVSLGVQSFID